jgi:hypothetical protein
MDKIDPYHSKKRQIELKVLESELDRYKAKEEYILRQE